MRVWLEVCPVTSHFQVHVPNHVVGPDRVQNEVDKSHAEAGNRDVSQVGEELFLPHVVACIEDDRRQQQIEEQSRPKLKEFELSLVDSLRVEEGNAESEAQQNDDARFVADPWMEFVHEPLDEEK